MNYIEVNITIPLNRENGRDIMVAYLSDMGFESFMDTEIGLNAYISEIMFNELNPDIAGLQGINMFGAVKISKRVIKDKNWNRTWEKNYKAVEIDNFCRIRTSFHDSKPGFSYQFVIEPRMSFGTGHHATTQLMIRLIRETNPEDMRVLDAGCGTGILSVLVSMMGAKEVIAFDNDINAYNNAKDNFLNNNTGNIRVLKGDIPDVKESGFDLVMANITKNVLTEHVRYYSGMMNRSAILLMSGFYGTDLSDIESEAGNYSLKYTGSMEENSWMAAKFIKT